VKSTNSASVKNQGFIFHRKKIFSGISILFFLSLVVNISQGALIPPEKSEIIIPENANPIVQFSAEELQKHLELISKHKIPISSKKTNAPFKFYVGIISENDKTPLNPEEARYRITPSSVYIYGDDAMLENIQAPLGSVLARSNRAGTLFAVYCFLEDQFGIKWPEPGDDRIVFTVQKNFNLPEKNYSWAPKLVRRCIRPIYNETMQDVPEKLRWTETEYAKRGNDIQIWLKRMRMGRSINIRYGHAFVTWWDKYGKTHPEYFALNEKGKRGPINPERPYFIKMCVSNPDLHKAIVKEWWTNPKTNKDTINTCENDGDGYCTCPECMKLDSDTGGDVEHKSFTDRYVFFTNSILAEAKKFNPEVKATMYAYAGYVQPPVRQRVSKDVIIGFVPSMLSDFQETDNMYKSWRNAGANEMFLRPNDQQCNTGLPVGFEKRLFDAFQIGAKNDIIGTDYDSLYNFWSITGISEYVLARAISDPSKSFEYWEEEYCSIYGPAKDDVKEFFRYWRNNFERRILPDKARIAELYGNFQKGLMPQMSKYYSLDDFDRTDAILRKGDAKKLSPAEHNRLEELILGNRHSRLTYEATVKTGQEKFDAAKKLLAFRIENKDKLNISWPRLAAIERKCGDTTGVQAFSKMQEFDNIAPTPFLWSFRIDPQNIGQTEKWQESYPKDINKWDRAQTNTNWENLRRHTSPELIEKLKNYDGIAWYATSLKIDREWQGKEIFLYFGAVDESCQLYINGKLAGERIYQHEEDWRTPFYIRIDPMIDWNLEKQKVVVRVEDKSGNGGIWQSVWLTTKEK